MLRIASKLNVLDNSGAWVVKIINLRRKKTYKASIVSIGDLVLVTIIKHKPNRKLKKGELVAAIVLSVKKKHSRHTGFFCAYGENRALPITTKKFWKPVATRIATRRPPFPLTRIRRYKLIVQSLYYFL